MSDKLHGINLESELVDYLETCCSGRFYREFASVNGKPFGTPEEIDAVKVACCVMIFGARGPSRAFTKRWPPVAAKIRELKKPSHKNVAHTLHRYESRLMIEMVCAALLRDHPDIPVLTIHDALLVPQDAVETAKAVIRRVWGRFGFIPHLKSMD